MGGGTSPEEENRRRTSRTQILNQTKKLGKCLHAKKGIASNNSGTESLPEIGKETKKRGVKGQGDVIFLDKRETPNRGQKESLGINFINSFDSSPPEKGRIAGHRQREVAGPQNESRIVATVENDLKVSQRTHGEVSAYRKELALVARDGKVLSVNNEETRH